MENFYKNQVVFMTGGTGFVGKMVLYQLLDMNIRKVFLLVRKKKGKGIQERIDELFAQVPFTTEQLGYKNNVVAVEGDTTAGLLGLDHRDLEMIQAEATVVIHLSASTRFDLSYSAAVRENVKSTNELLSVARAMGRLCALVHMSTAYSCCSQRFVEERVMSSDDKEAKTLLQTLDTNPTVLDEYSLQGYPNSYTLSKSHAESLVHYCNLPHAIVRPPLVVGSMQTPMPGWVDNFNNYNGIVAQCEFGLSLPLLMDPVIDINLIPVDMVANIALAAGWRCAEKPEGRGLVYNCTDGQSTLSAGQFKDKTVAALDARSSKPENSRRLSSTSSRAWQLFLLLILCYFPAMMADIRNWFAGRSCRTLSRVRTAYRRTSAFDYFLTTHFDFEYKNLPDLVKTLSANEAKKYPVDVSRIDWNLYITDIALGVARYAETFRNTRNLK